MNKIKFTPRDIGLWRGIFNFPPKMLPLPDYAEFDNAQDFMQFMYNNGIRCDDKFNPFCLYGDGPYCVVQFSKVGEIECSKFIAEKIKKYITDLGKPD